MTVTEVSLNEWEIKACVDTAITRMAVSHGKRLNHSNVRQRSHLTRIANEINGVCGEMAVCKALGKFWTPSVNTFHREPDIAPDIEVRTTDNVNGSLIVRDDDADDRWYFLVVGEPPTLNVVGYIRGAAAKDQRWLRNPHEHRPSYFVPQSALIPIRKAAV